MRNCKEAVDETQVTLLSAEASSDADTWVELQTLKHNSDSGVCDNANDTKSKHCYPDSLLNLPSSTCGLNSLPLVTTYSCVAAVLAICVDVVVDGLGAYKMHMQLSQTLLDLFLLK